MENSAPLTFILEDEFRGGDELTSREDVRERTRKRHNDDQDGRVTHLRADQIHEEHLAEADKNRGKKR